MFMRKYGKALASAFFAVLVAVYTALNGDNRIDGLEWIVVAIAFTNAVGVYLVPLAPQTRYSKTAVAVVLAVLQVLTTVIVGGIDSTEWILVLLSVGQALGVAAAPSVSNNGVASRTARTPATS